MTLACVSKRHYSLLLLFRSRLKTHLVKMVSRQNVHRQNVQRQNVHDKMFTDKMFTVKMVHGEWLGLGLRLGIRVRASEHFVCEHFVVNILSLNILSVNILSWNPSKLLSLPRLFPISLDCLPGF